ncbi:TetR/AcrR family transcriptional regulator [Demequina phytophila]|uniref:TetR/AcrR family transcriptional regulator n=1 Tax=Demequina phytophila TaxID=1638981 RepID=UPI0007826C49|nr:TetR/AcrR family transcriptional regulator [Demequina phytophila]
MNGEDAVPNVLPGFPLAESTEATTDPGHAPGTRGPYKRSEATRAAILGAAMDVFVEQGSRAASMREIARRAGVDQSTVLHHFPHKSALLLALMRERDARADALLAAEHPATPADVPAAMLALARSNAGRPDVLALYTLLAAESVTADHPLEEFFHERVVRVRAGFEEWFAALGAAGMLRDGVTPAFASASFFALWEGAQLHWLLDRDGVDVVALLAQFLHLITPDPKDQQ